MKNSYQKISAIAIVALFLFSSCSRELTSIPKTNKLANVQALEKCNAPMQSTEPSALANHVSAQPAMANKAITPTLKTNTTSKIAYTGKLGHVLMANVLPKKAAKLILKQANAIRNLGANDQVASYSKTSHTEGWLGLAVTLLIVGIILLALGFGTLGAIFWEIGVVILVVGIIFFILWLLASAAGA